VQNVKPIINGNPSVEPGYLHDETKFSTLRSALAVPLHTEAATVGAIGLYRSAKDAFSKDELRVVLALASKISMAVENALSFQDANTRARVDGLTGLPNATALFLYLEGQLAECKRSGAGLTVMVSDLNGFKQINDNQGHLVGNELLKRVGETFRSCCRETDYVGRMGGDEFVFVFANMPVGALERRMEQIDQAVRIAGAGIDAELSISIGSAVFPEDGTEAETLLAEADRRMYGVKRRRKVALPRPEFALSLTSLSEEVGTTESIGASAPGSGPTI
jgi:diguanylate cyclase (GGDEF)-like protein